jgi:hypothetical protein
MTTTLRLLQAEDEEGWSVYHGIRRHVLFELRGVGSCDEGHPDEHRQGHFPLLFRVDGSLPEQRALMSRMMSASYGGLRSPLNSRARVSAGR